MGFDPFSRMTDSRQTTRMVLLAIILLTLPCYCLGAVMLAYAPDSSPRQADATSATLGGVTASPRVSPTFTPFFTGTFTPFGNLLGATPTQIYLIPTVWLPSATPTPFPTAVPFATSTTAPTLTVLPSPTLAPTLTSTPTLPPTDAPPPTDVPPPTDAPPPTDMPPPTDSGSLATPTQETL